ncbi:beta/gamma crystallin domain-containing protein [Pseudomonas syringae group genomosp. 3]|uniref:beta/gamma crystallin domain-containing protein n=1 Tax=Pseudomonas syringae group genomosp. 3 TaxID=251701 RepID=UPI001604ABAC|nr:beta/gamma crystallin domain-containing protein [Pseudomonas syringae group genomosp. 3]
MERDHGAEFYTRVNYEGDGPYAYEESVVQYYLPSHLNDKFFSVKVGALSKVYGWHAYGDSDSNHQLWETSQADISSIRGLSKFVVSPSDSTLFAVKVNNEVGDGEKYFAFVRTFTIQNPVHMESGMDYEVVGLIPTDGRLYVTDIVIFERAGSQTWAQGQEGRKGRALNADVGVPIIHAAAYMYYDRQTDSLECTTYEETFSEHIELVKAEGYRFDLNIKSVPKGAFGRIINTEKLTRRLSRR